MTVPETLEKLKQKALKDESLRQALLATERETNSITQFCRIATEHGCPISAIELVEAGEESYAAMRRSTNGGGENSPLLPNEDDLYEMFLVEIE